MNDAVQNQRELFALLDEISRRQLVERPERSRR